VQIFLFRWWLVHLECLTFRVVFFSQLEYFIVERLATLSRHACCHLRFCVLPFIICKNYYYPRFSSTEDFYKLSFFTSSDVVFFIVRINTTSKTMELNPFSVRVKKTELARLGMVLIKYIMA